MAYKYHFGHAGVEGKASRVFSHTRKKLKLPASTERDARRWWAANHQSYNFMRWSDDGDLEWDDGELKRALGNLHAACGQETAAWAAQTFDQITVSAFGSVGEEALSRAVQDPEALRKLWDNGIEAIKVPEPSEHQARTRLAEIDKLPPEALTDDVEQDRLDYQTIVNQADEQDVLDMGNDVPPDMPSYSAPQGSRSEVAQLEAQMKADPDAWNHPDNQASRDRFNELHGATAWTSNAPTPTPEQQPRPPQWWNPEATQEITADE